MKLWIMRSRWGHLVPCRLRRYHCWDLATGRCVDCGEK